MKKNDLIEVIATRANALDYWAFMHYLPNPDPVLKRMGKDISAYREILSDSHIGGCVRRRKAAVKSLEWRLTPTDNKSVDDTLNALLDRLPLNNIITQLLDAPLFGYQVMEVMWTYQQGLWLPNDVMGKPQEWFVFDEDNQLMLRTKDSYQGRYLPDRKFLLATHQADYINPYGKADLAMCFWAATFKKGGFKFWLEFVEKYGSPWLVGKHPRQAQIHEIEELLDSMEKMLGTAVVAIPDDSSISMLESASKGGSSQVFDDFLKYCKSEIAIALLGQNQTTEAEANRASAEAGLVVTREIRDDDARIVESAINQLLRFICELNFKVKTLPLFELYEQESINTEQVERDSKLYAMGVQFKEPYITRTYGFEKGDIAMRETPPSPTSFSEPENSAHQGEDKEVTMGVMDRLTTQLEDQAEDETEKWLRQIRDQLAQAGNLEDFRARLDSLIPELSYAEYGELLAWGSTVAQFAGRVSVEDERRERKTAKDNEA